MEKIDSKEEMIDDKEMIVLEIIKDEIRITNGLLEVQERLVQLAHLAKEEKSDQLLEDQSEARAESQFGSQKTIRIKKAEWKNIKSTITREQLKILENH